MLPHTAMMLLRRLFSYLLAGKSQPVFLCAVGKQPGGTGGAGRVWNLLLLEGGVVRIHHLGLDHGELLLLCVRFLSLACGDK